MSFDSPLTPATTLHNGQSTDQRLARPTLSQNQIATIGSTSAVGHNAISAQFTPSQLLERIRAHVTTRPSTNEDLNNNILSPARALVADDLDIPLSAPLDAYDPIRAVHLTLNYLLNGNTRFPEDPRFIFVNLMDLYGDTKTYALVAAALDVEPDTLTPRQIHDFFARIAWVNEASINTPTARNQLDELLFGEKPLSAEAARLGKDEFSELGELLTGVPDTLQIWMLQFKRGERRDTASDWLAHCPAENLLKELTAYELNPAQSALMALSITLEKLLPTSGEYEDNALILSRNLHLTQPLMNLRIRVLPAAAQVPTWVDEDRSHNDSPPVEWSQAQTQDLGARLLRKVVLHALDASTEAWVPLTIENTQRAQGMQALSFANKLKQVHPALSTTGCLRLASLLLPPTPAAAAPSPLDPLPDSRSLVETLPAFSDWCTYSLIDDLFTNAGCELLCELRQGKRHLLIPASQTWQLMMRSSQFAEVFRPLLALAGWYGASPGESASPRATQALASRAIVDHFLGPRTPTDRSVTQDFHDHWVTEHSHLELRAKVSDNIRARNPNVSPAALSLLEYLLLRELAPELLITDTPDWLYYGRSLQSLALMHGARLLEAILPGACSRATYDKVITLASDLSSVDEQQLQRQWSSTLILPALRYAKAHGALPDFTGNDIRQATLQQMNSAVQFVTSEQQAFAQDAQQIALTPPDRKTLAEQQLAETGVDKQYWDKSIDDPWTWSHLSGLGLAKSSSYNWHHTIATPGFTSDVGAPSQKPVIENLTQLIMTGDIYRDGKSTVPQLYDQAFETFKSVWQAAHARLIKRLFLELPQALRNKLYTSTCEVSLITFEGPPNSKEQAGTQGLFIRCQPGDHRDDFDTHEASTEYFFELTPGAGALRPCSQQFNYKVVLNTGFSGNIVETVAKRWENNDRKLQARVTPLQPLDSDAYLNGTPSRLADKLQTPRKGKLIAATERVYAQQDSEADFFQKLATTATTHLYASTLAQFKADHTHTTPWEELVDLEKQFADFLGRTLLPFYGCIADLVKGDHSAGVIIGCVLDAVGVLIPAGKFIASSLTLIRDAANLTLRAACEVMSSAVGELFSHLAQQSPILIYRDMGRGIRWLSVKSWEKLAQPALRWLHDLRGAPQLLHMTEEGTYAITREALSASGHAFEQGELARVGNSENTLVRNLGSADESSFKLLDPHDNLPYGPRLITEGTPQEPKLTPLKSLGSISPGHYPSRIAGIVGEDEKLGLAIDDACSLRVRAKGEGHYDIHVDEQHYHLDARAHDLSLTELSNTPTSTLDEITPEEMLCRLKRDLEESSCTPFTKLISLPAERLRASQPNPLTRGQEISQAFEAREFHLERRSTVAYQQTPARSFDLLVHEGKFCKWDHAPIKGTRPVKFTTNKQLLALSADERTLLGLPETPTYQPQVIGRMSSDRHFGLLPDTSGAQAKTITPHVPVVALEQVCEQVVDKRMLRGIKMEWNAQPQIYVEVDNGKFYKTRQGPGELTFTPVTDAAEIGEYLRLSNQYRFVAERPYAAIDRDNIAQLLYATLVEKREPGLQAWLASAPANKDYATYAQWCVDNNERNEMLHYAENILSGERPQTGLVEETRSLISDWKVIGQRNLADKRSTVQVLTELLPIQGKDASWVPLSTVNIDQQDVARMISAQMNNSNLAFASVLTKDGRKFVYYALAGGERAKNLHLKPYRPGQPTQRIGDTTYVDARSLMSGRAPDPGITSLPVIRHAGRVSIRPFDRYLDSERLIATILKEQHPRNSIYSIHMFTRMDTCRSCGGVVLPQLTLNYTDADFWVTYLEEYRH
ncbi:deaminase domain-containing protein [Pseudomonas entomophila]|uniref:deaminase domain-containing protein n=1 Tax=Pseudomonas entomophila TaxID=312306 RepID=UPI002405451D|nr:deaminase domain-containing protein [Pseudomonas entomophila]MDF9616694.1 deaminase domain-containing protein [Pseudomonas entomophila]